MDKVDKYEHLLITDDLDYEYWNIFLFGDQRYLGRCYAWIKRDTPMLSISMITVSELLELQELIGDWEYVIKELWSPNIFNYAWFGNNVKKHNGHGHMHLIPRYKLEDKKCIHGVLFEDERVEQNYSPYIEHKLSEDVMQLIKIEIREGLHELLY